VVFAVDRGRSHAYRKILAGLRYHRGEKLSLITFGFRRGSDVDDRIVLQKLMTWIKRERDFRVEFFRVRVRENNSDDEKWRIHVHMIWNAPYIQQSAILEKMNLYLGDSGSVFIKLLDDNEKNTARYLMQYLGNQDGEVRYTMSRNWLPKGYSEFWNETRHDFYEHVPLGVRMPLDDGEKAFQLMTQRSDAWRKEALIENVNLWIDEQRVKLLNPVGLKAVTCKKTCQKTL
jgi:hypothetical protein